MSTIKIRRGNNASLPSGGTVAGEPRFSTDTGQFYIDDGTNNIEITPNTTNVAAAGALMDSECTSLADVKALDQSVVSGASPTFSTANMTDATNKRFMTDAQETVLDNTSGTNTGDESAATTSAAGIVELATGAETVTGTDTGRAVTPDGLTDRLASPGDIGGTAAGDVNYVTGIGTVSALGNLGATEAIDWSTATHFTGTLDSASTTITHTNEASGIRITLVLTGSASSTSVTFSNVDVWLDGTDGSAPNCPGDGETLIVTMLYVGTTCYASAGGDFALA